MSGAGDALDEATEDSFLAYLPSIFWQRRWWLIAPSILGLAAGTAAAFLIPATYRSSAVLLVESPQLASETIGSPSISMIDQRIAKIRQQVLSRPDLIQLIEANGLYAERRQSEPLSKLIDHMRDATSLSPVNADIAPTDKGSSTIAFSLTFDYPDAQKAQVVAQDFVERLLKLDASQTAQQAAGTVQFLQDQADELARQMTTIEQQINQIKSANGVALSTPGMMMAPTSGGNQTQIAALRRDNAQLSAQLSLQASAADRDPAVVAAEAQLAGARSVYSDDHPDVRLAQQRLAEAKQFAARNRPAQRASGDAIRQQIASNNATISALMIADTNELTRYDAMRGAQARAPVINEQVAQLQAKLDGLRQNYQASATKLMSAKSTEKLAEQQKGERLSVIDPPVVPDSPSWPNRPLLIAGGLVAGFGLGFVLMVLLEIFLRPIRGLSALQRITGEAPLVVIPKLKDPKRSFSLPSFRRRSSTQAAG